MKYSTIFTVEILHDFFTETKSKMFRIVPDKRTSRLLLDAGMIAKYIDNKLYIFVKHVDNTTPLLSFTNNFTLQFFIEVVDFDFNLITNFSQEDPYNRKLFFSNLNSIIDQNDKSVENVLYIHEKLPLFNSAKGYEYNDLVRSGSNNAYECLKKVNPGSGNLNNSGQFRKLEKVSYVSNSSSLLFVGSEKLINLNPPADTVDIKYFKFNPASKLYDLEIKSTTLSQAENPGGDKFESVLLKFYLENGQEFPEDIYRITINAREEFVYFRSENDWQEYLGLINIHYEDLVPVNYRFLNSDGSFILNPPASTNISTRNYVLRFAPAQYLLKYKCKTNKVINITDDDGKIEFDNLGSNIFQSKLPVRMSEKAIDTITVKYNGADEIKKTKNPGYRKLSLADDENKYLISEIFLNL